MKAIPPCGFCGMDVPNCAMMVSNATIIKKILSSVLIVLSQFRYP